MDWHVEAAEGDHFAAMGEMEVVERRLLEIAGGWDGRGMARSWLWEKGETVEGGGGGEEGCGGGLRGGGRSE